MYIKKRYKPNDIFNNKITENYLMGIRVNSKGIKEKLSTNINKYNKEIIEEVSKINTEFYKLISTNKVLIKVIERYHGDISELKNISNIIYGQSGTIKYNRALKYALRKYGITHRDVYEALRNDIGKQKDRLKRNERIIRMLLDELGLLEIYKVVEDTTSMKFGDYLVYLEANSNIDKPSCLDVEAEKKYYEDLTNYQFGAVIGIIDSHKINVDSTIKESLLNNRKRLATCKNKDNELEIDLLIKIEDKLKVNSCNIQRDITTSYYESLAELNRHEATELIYEIEKIGKEVYYVNMIRYKNKSQSEVGYCDEHFRVTYDVLEMKLFMSKQEAEHAIIELQNRYNVQGFIVVARVQSLNGIQGNNKEIDTRFYESRLGRKNLDDAIEKAEEQYNKMKPGIEKLKLKEEIERLKSARIANEMEKNLSEVQQRVKIEHPRKRRSTYEYNWENELGSIINKLNKFANKIAEAIKSETDQYTLIDMLDRYDIEELECDNQDFAEFFNQCTLMDAKVKTDLKNCSDTFLTDSIYSYKKKGKESIFAVSVLKDGKIQYFSNSIPSTRVCERLTDDIANATLLFTRKSAQNKRDIVLRSIYGSKLDKIEYGFEPIVRVTEINLQGENTNEYSQVS